MTGGGGVGGRGGDDRGGGGEAEGAREWWCDSLWLISVIISPHVLSRLYFKLVDLIDLLTMFISDLFLSRLYSHFLLPHGGQLSASQYRRLECLI